MEDLLPILLGLTVIIGIPGLAIAGFVQARRARREIAELRAELALLRRMPPAAASEAAPGPAAPPAVSMESVEPAPEALPPAPPVAAAPARHRLEESLTSRWLVWLGGVALALGGGFLVKYSIDAGLLSPAVRVLLGLLLAAGLVAAGERLRHRPLRRSVAGAPPDHVPAAMVAAGVCTAFAALYAAYALYGLIGSAFAFAALGAVAFGAIGLSLAQGPFVAGLGVAGAYLVPLLVSSEEPAAWPLFTFLFFVAAAGVGVVRYRGWWWLSWITLVGAAAWPLFWAAAAWAPGDGFAVGPYLVLLAALFLAARFEGAEAASAPQRAKPRRIALAAAAAVAALAFVLMRMDAYGMAGFGSLTTLALLYLFMARREPDLALLAPLASCLVAVVLAVWHQPVLIDDGAVRPPLIPLDLQPFALACLLYGAGFAVVGFLALWGAARPGLWAGISVATPLALLVLAYARLTEFAVDPGWAAIGLGLAAAFLAAAARVARSRSAAMDEALGAYAAGVAGCIALAAAMSLREAWLTVALALELPVLAWVHDRLRVPALRAVSFALAVGVLVRLLFNHEILDYPEDGGISGLSWMLYGYGLPAACFYAAARLFRLGPRDPLTALLDGGALTFATLLVTLEIRYLVAGGIDALDYGLAEQSLQSIAWATIAYALFRAARSPGRPVLRWGWPILAGLAAAQSLVLQALVDNPLWTAVPVGDVPLFNLLLLAYAAPGLLALLFAGEAARQGRGRLAIAAGAMAMAMILLWISLETRRAFHGTILSGGGTSQGELYAYSAVWLLYAGGLLALGLWRGVAVLRYASLTIVLLTVAKVFLLDMAELEGLYRVLSFLGLGAALVATGFLYQRFVFPSRMPAEG